VTRSLSIAACAFGGLIAMAGTASAMPFAPSTPPVSTPVQDIAWGCGPGWHPNYWGRCVPNAPVYYYGWSHPAYYGWHRRYGWYGSGHWHRW